MYVFVLNQNKQPLMPTNPAKARILLKSGKAKVVRRNPFTIKLLYNTSDYTQPCIAGMDTGSHQIGCAVMANKNIVYQSEITVRNDISKKMQQRAMYRRTRRTRKTRYRPARFNNRGNSRKLNRLPPSIRSKIESHLRERRFIESILPVSKWIVETASFDIHKIINPDVTGTGYQNGSLKGFYNVKSYVLNRDNYTCQHCKGKNKDNQLQCHHIKFRSNGGTDTPENLVTLCKTCHENLHNGKFSITKQQKVTKHATQIGIVKSQLIKTYWNFKETFGYETKYKREQVLNLPKTHYNDAIAICCNDKTKSIQTDDIVYFKKHVSKGDYQQRKGKRSEKTIPTGKLHGLRKFDLIKTIKGIGFVKGKRSSGYFSLMDIFGNTIHDSVNVKKEYKRVSARTTTITQKITI
jgi:hypothetical protein